MPKQKIGGVANITDSNFPEMNLRCKSSPKNSINFGRVSVSFTY
ncbi:hypothetical protein [Emticicia sp.]